MEKTELIKAAVDLLTGAGVMVTLVYVFKFSRWTGIVDSRLKSLEDLFAAGKPKRRRGI